MAETKEMSAIERAARALCAFDGKDPDEDYRHDPVTGITIDIADDSPARWTIYQGKAKAVLRALREPSEAMIKAGHTATERQFDLTAAYTAIWREMINAALAE